MQVRCYDLFVRYVWLISSERKRGDVYKNKTICES